MFRYLKWGILASMDTVTHNGVEYVKAGVAAKRFKYTKDYIGQLCRAEKIDARMIGRSWYVNIDSLEQHKSTRYESVKNDQSKAAPDSVSVAVHAVHDDALSERDMPAKNNISSRTVTVMVRDREPYTPLNVEHDASDLIPTPKKKSELDLHTDFYSEDETRAHPSEIVDTQAVHLSLTDADAVESSYEIETPVTVAVDMVEPEAEYIADKPHEKPLRGVLSIVEDTETPEPEVKQVKPKIVPTNRVVSQKGRAHSASVRHTVSKSLIKKESSELQPEAVKKPEANNVRSGNGKLVLAATVLALLTAVVLPFLSWQHTLVAGGQAKSGVTLQLSNVFNAR